MASTTAVATEAIATANTTTVTYNETATTTAMVETTTLTTVPTAVNTTYGDMTTTNNVTMLQTVNSNNLTTTLVANTTSNTTMGPATNMTSNNNLTTYLATESTVLTMTPPTEVTPAFNTMTTTKFTTEASTTAGETMMVETTTVPSTAAVTITNATNQISLYNQTTTASTASYIDSTTAPNKPQTGGLTGNWFLDNQFDIVSFWFGALAFVSLAVIIVSIFLLHQCCKKKKQKRSRSTTKEDTPVADVEEQQKTKLKNDLEQLAKTREAGTDCVVVEYESEGIVNEEADVSDGELEKDDDASVVDVNSEEQKLSEVEERKDSNKSLIGIVLSQYKTNEADKNAAEEHQTTSFIVDKTLNDTHENEDINEETILPQSSLLDIIVEENEEKSSSLIDNIDNKTIAPQEENTTSKYGVQNDIISSVGSTVDVVQMDLTKEESIDLTLNSKEEENAKTPEESQNKELSNLPVSGPLFPALLPEHDVTSNPQVQHDVITDPQVGEDVIAGQSVDHIIKFEKDESGLNSSDSSSSSSRDSSSSSSSDSEIDKKGEKKTFSKKKRDKKQEDQISAEQKRINYERFQEKIRGLVKKYEGDEEGDESQSKEEIVKAEDLETKKDILEEALKNQTPE